jgi:hypothetical protein
MFASRPRIAILAALVALPALAGETPRREDDPERLVTRLGVDDFGTRVEAAEKLEALGEKALPALHKAIRSNDPEVLYRARKAIRAIENPLKRDVHARKGHTGQILSVAFDKEGERCASGSFDTTVRVWDVATGKELHALEGHKTVVDAVAVSGDGK